jgi:predicted phage terminase large subunit-like protein
MWLGAGDGTFGDSWEAFHFCSLDNPMIDPQEIEEARRTLSKEAFEQEFMASFTAASGGAFVPEDFEIIKERPPGQGTIYIAVDPNGFKDTKGMVQSKLKKLDETAISVVDVRPDGWYVLEIIHGRWGTRETSLKIIRAAQKYRPAALGVENLDTIKPYLVDQMRRLNVYPDLQPLKHMGQKKTDRIIWALQGRSQNGRIKLVEGPWNQHLLNQLRDFPNPLAHDDLPDSLAYIDQLATTVFAEEWEYDDWEPLDDVAGY